MSSRISADHIRLKRAYKPPASDDGIRILIDRIWPRGVKKTDAAIDEWMKEIAPSTKLRKWFSHDPERWQEFRRRYQTEIRHHPDEFDRLRTLAQRGRIVETLRPDMSCIQMRLAPRGNGRFIPRTLVFGGQLGGIS
jgi:uncharacterized protein YeaO (DUF488 family)